MADYREILLIIMACTTNSNACEEHRLTAYEMKSEGECMSGSLGVVTQWLEQRPDLVLDHWRCEVKKR
jgi:hypothetical protein